MVAKAKKHQRKIVGTKRSKLFPWRRVEAVDASHVPKARTLIADTLEFIGFNFRAIGGMSLIYAVIFVLVVALANRVNLLQMRDFITQIFGDAATPLATTTTLLGFTLGTAFSSSVLISFNGVMLIIIFSLAFIWAIRHLQAGTEIKLRDPFYKGMAPIIPFLMILLLIGLELLPFAITTSVYSTLKTAGLIAVWHEELTLIIFCGIGAIISGYLLTNAVMALYAVTIPDVYPGQALRATKQIVKGLRGVIFRRMITLPLILAVLWIAVLLIFIRFAPAFAFWALYAMAVVSLPIVHIYLYKLYRSLV